MRHDASSSPGDPCGGREDEEDHARRVTSVAVVGASTPLGRRVVDLVAADPSVQRIVAVDLDPPSHPLTTEPPVVALERDRSTAVERVSVGLGDDLATYVSGVSSILYMAFGGGGDLDPSFNETIAPSARRVLETATAVEPGQLVIVSSATVYGAWVTNPVPLTEEAPVRPNPGFDPGVVLAEVERLTREWNDCHPACAVAVLRPVTTVAPDRPGWLARGLRSALAFPVEGHDPPTQFLHIDDLADAVDRVRRRGWRGPLNVAPDGWLEGDERRSLDGRPRLHLPAPVASRVHGWRWRLGVAPTPPALLPYAVHPWVVANDRLRSIGWAPSFTNEEAWVAGHPAGPIASLSPRRRQELILGAAGAAAAATAVAVGALARHRRR